VEQACRGKYFPRNVYVTSFTKAGAQEAASRVGLPDSNVGTLHSFCYRNLGQPEIAETRIKEFCADYGMKLSNRSGAMDDGGIEEAMSGEHDALLNEYGRLRNKLIPMELWPGSIRSFASKWEAFKQKYELLDFTDMLERNLDSSPPEECKVMFVDEAQDMTPLQMKIVRHWGKGLDYYVNLMDDDQVLYRFTGAGGDFAHDVPPERRRVLAQSYRVPQEVHKLACGWIKKVSRRAEKEYLPTSEVGFVQHRDGFRYSDPEPIVRDIERHVDNGKSVMVLASCGYMLTPMIKALKGAHLTYCNPYRVSRGDWNPIPSLLSAEDITMEERLSKKKLGLVDRMIAFMEPELDGPGSDLWSLKQAQSWTHILKDIFAHGWKQKAEKCILRPADEGYFEWMNDFYAHAFRESLVLDAMDLKPEFLLEHCTASIKERLAYMVKLIRNSKDGVAVLKKKPRIVVGTIHSVKGGEADIVYVSPDIALSSLKEARYSKEAKDSIIRQYYVAYTRAREGVVLCGKSSSATCHVI
jgi:superfamily I DNA/RNA helicase